MSSKTYPLMASQEKIKRAKKKFDYLKATVNRYVNSKPFSIRTERHDDTFYVVTCIDKDIPEDVVWEAVEAIGHLRSALDKMVVDLVTLNCRGLSAVAFPFGGMDGNGKPNAFPTDREDRIKKKLTPEQWAFIEAQKPYPGGNDILWSINEIANADKHRKGLVTIVSSLDRTSVGLGGASSPAYYEKFTIRPMNCEFILKDQERETVLASFGAGSVNQQINVTTTDLVVFGDVTPVQGKNLLVTLNQQIRLVESMVGICKSRFF